MTFRSDNRYLNMLFLVAKGGGTQELGIMLSGWHPIFGLLALEVNP